MHEAMAARLDAAVEQIKQIQHDARINGNIARPRWPMIVLNSPKAGRGQRRSRAGRMKAPSARIRFPFPIPLRIPTI